MRLEFPEREPEIKPSLLKTPRVRSGKSLFGNNLTKERQLQNFLSQWQCGFNIAPTYEEVVNNTVRIPVTDPYVRIVLVDYLYNGFCAIVSYEALNKFVVDKGEVDANEQDFNFYNVFILNVS